MDNKCASNGIAHGFHMGLVLVIHSGHAHSLAKWSLNGHGRKLGILFGANLDQPHLTLFGQSGSCGGSGLALKPDMSWFQ